MSKHTDVAMSKHVGVCKLAVTALLLTAAAFVTGCASAPAQRAEAARPAISAKREQPREPALVGDAVADLAMGMVGIPYRYGGADPRQGFDCSGLVFYTYGQIGYRVPRTSQELFKATRKIGLDNVNAGDLMFFQDQEKLSHVGIYVGDGLFVHAPSSGQTVSVASIDTPYYQRHLVAVGRLLPN